MVSSTSTTRSDATVARPGVNLEGEAMILIDYNGASEAKYRLCLSHCIKIMINPQ